MTQAIYHNFSKPYRISGMTTAPATVPNMLHDQTDNLYWKLWTISRKTELAAIVNPAQLADFMAEISGMTQYQQFLKISRQIALEDARAMQETECTCTPFDPIACPVCQKLADEREIEF